MDLLFHMLIPVMLAWISGVDRRKALMLAPIAVIPDLDMLFSAHRVCLHTLFIPMAIVAVSYLYKKLKRGFHLDFIFLASLFYLSHLLLDFFPGSVAILWPIINLGYGLDVSLTVSQKSAITVQPHLAVTAKQIQIPNIVTNAEAVTPQSLVTAILLLATIIMVQRKKILRFHI